MPHRSTCTARLTAVALAAVLLTVLACAPPAAAGRSRQAGTSAEAAARRHLDRIGPHYGVAAADLRTSAVSRVAGRDLVRFQQTVHGLPVLGGQLVTVLDRHGRLLSVSGETSRRGGAAPSYDIAASTAARTAVAAVAAAHDVPAATLRTERPTRWLLDRSLLERGASASLHAVWRVPVRSGRRVDVRDTVLVDARSGQVAIRLGEVATLDRVVCDDVRTTAYRCRAGLYDRTEGAPATGVVDADQAYDLTGATATWFAGTLGVDLTALIGTDTGDGRRLRSTTNYCPPGSCPLDNAFWAGDQMVYGAGYTSADDVVAHELTHGVTQHTAGLVYWYQSGAVNESMSDVLGELVDLADGIGNDLPEVRWRLGEDLPAAAGGVTRDMADPTRYAQPDTTASPYYDPAADYDDNGAVHTNSGVPNKTAYLIVDGTAAEPGGAFQGRAFPGIGTARASVLYWTTLQMLTPGADFQDLAAALRQACTDLAFSPQECVTVGAAVDVTGLGVGAGPSRPRAVTMTAATGKVSLTWTRPVSSGTSPLRSYVLAVSPDVRGDDFFALKPAATHWVLADLPPGVDYTVRLVAVNADGTSPAVVRTFAGRRLTSSGPAAVAFGRRVQVSGTLRTTAGKGLAARRVRLVRREPGVTPYSVAGVARTRRDGSFAFEEFAPRRRIEWYVVSPGGGSQLGARGPRQRTLVTQRVTLDPADLTVPAGGSISLGGAVRPARSGRVALQRQGPAGDWVAVRRAQIGPGGRWSLTWRVPSDRPTALRVRVGARAEPALAAGTSRTLTLNPR